MQNGGSSPQNRASPAQIRVEFTCFGIFGVGRGGEGIERDSPRTLRPCHPHTPSYSLSLPLAPSRSLFLSLLVPVTLNPQVVWGGETPFLKGADDRDWMAGRRLMGGKGLASFSRESSVTLPESLSWIPVIQFLITLAHATSELHVLGKTPKKINEVYT